MSREEEIAQSASKRRRLGGADGEFADGAEEAAVHMDLASGSSASSRSGAGGADANLSELMVLDLGEWLERGQAGLAEV